MPYTIHAATVTQAMQSLAALPPDQRIQTAREIATHTQWLVEDAVHAMRIDGASWDQVARALGTSRQGAHKRYSADAPSESH